MIRAQQNIIATIAYRDIFDYPLTRAEIHLWGVGGGVPRIFTLPRGLIQRDGYVVFVGRECIVGHREQKHASGRTKWETARKAGRMLSRIPTVMCIGVTGGLAMDNAADSDDIDLFFICRRGTLWITRMLVTIVSECMRIRRRPHDHRVSDKVCLNMFMAEDNLEVPHAEQDLFSAHEVLQMKPLWDRGSIHRRFLDANSWVAYFLPNAWMNVRTNALTVSHANNMILYKAIYVLARCIEPIAKWAQLAYMKNKRTNEVIRSGMIRFHPHDARVWIREKYQKRLKRWDIPIDKFFYHR